MTRVTALLLLFSSVHFASTAHCQEPGGADPTVEGEKARELLKQGLAEMDANNYEAAARSVAQAWNTRRSYDVASVLGQIELKLGHYRDAAEHLDYALRDFAPGASRDVLLKVQEGFAEATSQVATLRITVSSNGAEVRVDDVVVGISPLTAPIFAEPGSHLLEARQGQDSSATTLVQASAGKEFPVHLELIAAARRSGAASATQSSVAAAQPVSPSIGPGGPSRSLVPVYIGAGVFAVGAAITAGFGLAAHSAKEDVARFRGKTGSSDCATGEASASDCSAAKDTYDRERTDARIAKVGIAIAAVGGLGTAAYLIFWPRRSESVQDGASRASLLPSVVLERQAFGVSLSGGF